MNFKKFLVLLMTVCLSVAFLACQKTTSETTDNTTTTEQQTTTDSTITDVPSTTMNILNGWVDSGDSVYTITQDDTSLQVSYDKNGFSWANMAYTIDTDLSDYNKLVFTISGQGTLMVKVQGATEAFEVSIQLTAGEVTYQLNLRDYDEFLTGVTGVFIFAAPGKANDTGNFTISKFEFDEGTAYGNVLENGDNLIPQNQQIYDGTGETFDFRAGFIDNGDGIYTIDNSGNDPIVSYTKAAGFEWAYLISTVVGDFSDFDYVVLKIKGVQAGTVMLKAELSASVNAELSATYEADEEVTICLDLSSWTDEQLDSLTKILLFADGGSASTSGSFILQEAYFSKVYVGEPIVETDYYDFLTGWTEGDAGTYTFTTTEEETTLVNYTKNETQSWSLMRNDFTQEVEGYNTLILTVKGEAGKSILVKPNDSGALEQTILFDGTEQTITVTADSFTNILIFAEPNMVSVSGSFEIIVAKVVYVEPAPLAASEEYDLQDNWVDNDGGIYTFTNTDGVVTVSFTRTEAQNWTFIKNIFSANLTNHDTIELVVQGTAGQQLLIKPNDNGAYEQTITFDGTVQTITIQLSEKPVSLLIFVDPLNAGLTGTFDIISAKVIASNPTQVNFINDFEENDLNTYAFTPLADGVQVDYTKVATQEWAFMKVMFNATEVEGLNTLLLTINGEAGKSILIKPNDSNDLQYTLDFDGTDQTVIITADAFQSLLMFVEGGNLGTGTFVIKEAKLYYEEANYDFKTGWVDNGDAVYTFTENTDGTVTVDYTKAAGQAWSAFRNEFTVDAEGFNTMTLVLKGEAGKTILIKPNDNGALEQTITFDGTEQTFVISFSAFTKIIIFAEPNTESVTGSFDIIEAKLTYVEPDALPAWEEVVLDNSWVDKDGGIYTFTEDAGVVTVDFSKTETQAWAAIEYTFDVNLDNHDTLTFIVNGTVGQQIIIKPNNNGAFEQTVTFDGTDQTVTITLTEALTSILIFVDPLNGGLTGSFDIVSATVTSTSATYDFKDLFTENDPGTYTFTTQLDGSILVDYTKAVGQDWVFMKAEFDQEAVNGLNTIRITLIGEAGKSILVKPNDSGALEQTFTFDGTEQVLVIQADSFSNIIIFAEAGSSDLTGSFTIIAATITHETIK